MYTIRAQYGPQEINDKVMVELVGESGEEEGAACNADELALKGGSTVYCVPFESSGAIVTKASVSSATSSIVLMIETESDGSISLKIPRSVLESQSNGGDTDFIVLVDDEEADFEETGSDDESRTIDITFPEGATQVEIIGTWAVPEFGTMAAIILAVAIVSIIAVSARTRLSILPRY
jgi:predicted secreted protein with PEFG-CTERM motif